MGKLKGAVKFRGKLNDVVGYKLGNSVKEGYGVRNLQTDVKNPQSEAQATQRMKLPAAQNFYRGLATILDHSWEGVKYGARSYSEILKRAMLMAEGYPYVTKGTKKFVPGEYQISDGSLTPVFCDIANSMASTSLNITGGLDSTVGEASQALLDSNPFLQDGDQITFVSIITYNQVRIYIPVFARFVIDVNSTVELSAWRESQKTVLTPNGGVVAFYPNGFDADATTICGAAVILSRPPRNVGGSWMRSPATLVLTEDFKNVWMSPTQRMLASLSYQGKAAGVASSPYYLNQGNYGEGGSTSETVQRSIVNAQSEVTGASSAFLVEDGVSRLIVNKNSNSSRVTTYYQFNGVSNLAPVSIVDTINFDEETMVLIATVQNYFPDITTYSGGNNDPIEDRP